MFRKLDIHTFPLAQDQLNQILEMPSNQSQNWKAREKDKIDNVILLAQRTLRVPWKLMDHKIINPKLLNPKTLNSKP